jgi:hypothetical protein
MIFLLQWFNEAILGPTAVVLDLAMRSLRALFFGFRAVAVEMGAESPIGTMPPERCWRPASLPAGASGASENLTVLAMESSSGAPAH